MSSVYRPRLRILIDPIYVQAANLSGSSTYHKYVSLVRELISRGHYVYWCVPDSNYTPNKIEDHPNVGVIRTSYIQDQFVIDGLITDDFFNLFNRVAGKYHVDVLCTSRTSLALMYKRILEAPRFHDSDNDFTDKSYGLPVTLIEEFPQTRERQHSSRSYWQMQCQGYLGADDTIFLSAHNREEVTKEMQDWFKTSIVSDWAQNKTHLIAAGIECKELDRYYDPDRYKHEKDFSVISIGRIFGPSYAEYLPWFDYLYRRGDDTVSMTISLSGALSGPMRKKLKKIGFDIDYNAGRQFKILENNPRTNFLRMLKRFHAFVVPVSHLDHPTGIFEALYLGVPGVMPESDYQRTFFSDYPFVIKPKDKADLLANLKWINEHRDEAREMILPWRDRIKELYNAPDNICKLADVIENAGHRHIDRFKTSKGVVNLCKRLQGDIYYWDDIVAHLRKAGKMGVSIGDMSMRTTFTYAQSAIHHAMGLAGYVDVCDGPEVKFVRRDVFDKKYNVKRKLKIKPKGKINGKKKA